MQSCNFELYDIPVAECPDCQYYTEVTNMVVLNAKTRVCFDCAVRHSKHSIDEVMKYYDNNML